MSACSTFHPDDVDPVPNPVPFAQYDCLPFSPVVPGPCVTPVGCVGGPGKCYESSKAEI